jgi:chromosomal replication initiator protein
MMHAPIRLTYTQPPIAFINPIRRHVRHSMDIKLAVCRAFNVSMHDLIGPSRKDEFVRPRQAAYYLMSKRTNLSLTQIAQSLGRTDHSTVISGIKYAKALIDHCPEFADMFARAAR